VYHEFTDAMRTADATLLDFDPKAGGRQTSSLAKASYVQCDTASQRRAEQLDRLRSAVPAAASLGLIDNQAV
jgi:hypothetical protein